MMENFSGDAPFLIFFNEFSFVHVWSHIDDLRSKYIYLFFFSFCFSSSYYIQMQRIPLSKNETRLTTTRTHELHKGGKEPTKMLVKAHP